MDLLGKIFTPNKKIFVQIASYRDPELVPTVRDLISKADNPNNLRICILNQWHEEDDIDLVEWKDDPRFEILSAKSHESKGVCWARNILNTKYDGEKYTLQIDSHHRFIQGWDTELISMLDKLIENGVKKPILTAYAPPYYPQSTDVINTPLQIDYDKFTPEGILLTKPSIIPDHENLTSPIKSRFISGHFIFTLGKFVNEVPYDRELYFYGEEITMAVRAFTNGWDLYTPHKVILYHEYTREGKPKHWDEYKRWEELDNHSHDRIRKLLGIDGKVCTPCLKKRMGVYHLGTKRTKEEYEQYSGIHFQTRGVTDYTLSNQPPPNPKINLEEKFLKLRDWEVKFPKILLDDNLDFEFWAIILLDDQGVELFRQDLKKGAIDAILKENTNEITYRGTYKGRPYKNWVVWPHGNGEWLRKIIGEKI